MPIGDPNWAGFLRLAHHVKDAVGSRNVEITINFAAAIVGMAGHGIPNAAGLEFGEAEDELAAFDAVFVDVLENGALVAFFLGAEFYAICIGTGGLGGRVGGVGGIADEVENGGLGGGGAGEGDLLAATANIEAIVGSHFIGRAIDGDAACATKVEDAKLAALKEKIGFERCVIAELKGLSGRDGAADDGAVEIGVNKIDVVGGKKFVEEKSGAEFRRIKNGGFAGRRHESSFHDISFVVQQLSKNPKRSILSVSNKKSEQT